MQSGFMLCDFGWFSRITLVDYYLHFFAFPAPVSVMEWPGRTLQGVYTLGLGYANESPSNSGILDNIKL